MEFFLVHIQIFNKFITLSVTLTEIPVLFFSKLHSEVLHTSFLFSSCRFSKQGCFQIIHVITSAGCTEMG